MPSTKQARPGIRISAAGWAAIIVATITVLGGIAKAIIDKWPMPGQQPPTLTFTAVAASATVTPPAPSETPTPTPTDTPSLTPTPTWLARITYPALSDIPVLTTRYIDMMGEYRADLTDDIWVFVHDPNDLYYPESMDPCTGQGTPRVDGRWEIYFGVGVDDSDGQFEVVLTTTTAKASTLIASDLMKGCRSGIFPSYVELPPEVTEHQRVALTRRPVIGMDGMYPLQPPPLPDAGLAGQISVSAFGSNGKIGKEEIITGATTGGPGAIWTLVYTFYGRWYPQSLDPCIGAHTERTGDQWKTKAIFGGNEDAGKPFYMAVVLADEEASTFLDRKQREFCAQKHYPGFQTIELPGGISAKYTSKLIRR